jgi:hypothetical protein
MTSLVVETISMGESPPPRRTLTLWTIVRCCWRFTITTLIVLFVCWHLFFLLLRSGLDLSSFKVEFKKWTKEQDWWKEIEPQFTTADELTARYGRFMGVEQGWAMFTPPLARSAPFLTTRLVFTNGEWLDLPSDNEPDPAHFFRFGGWRFRKLEDGLVKRDPPEVRTTEDRPVYESYVRWRIQVWRERFPDDERVLQQVVLIHRRIYFPKPGTDPTQFGDTKEWDVAYFSPEGKVQ